MPSDTVGVAIVGFGTTVGALIVQGWLSYSAEQRRIEREDQQRVEDRVARISEQNLADRRSLYARLLASAIAPRDSAFAQLVNAERQGGEWDDQAKAALDDYRAVAAAAEMEAVDRAVLQAANELGDAAGSVIGALWLLGISGDEDRRKHGGTLRRIDRELLLTLRDTCRRDLGYDLEPPSDG